MNECIKHGIDIIPLPGPSAVTTAVSISGFNEINLFLWFFSRKRKSNLKELKKLSILNFCIVFFISSKKIKKIIPFIKDNFKEQKNINL